MTTKTKAPKGFRMARIELPIPEDCLDLSELLERATELAVGLAEEFHEDPDDEDNSGEAFDPAVLDDQVSVELLP